MECTTGGHLFICSNQDQIIPKDCCSLHSDRRAAWIKVIYTSTFWILPYHLSHLSFKEGVKDNVLQSCPLWKWRTLFSCNTRQSAVLTTYVTQVSLICCLFCFVFLACFFIFYLGSKHLMLVTDILLCVPEIQVRTYLVISLHTFMVIKWGKT